MCSKLSNCLLSHPSLDVSLVLFGSLGLLVLFGNFLERAFISSKT